LKCDGSILEVDFREGTTYSERKLSLLNGDIYTGDFEDECPVGKLKLKNNKEEYHIIYYSGKKNGKRLIFFPDGNVYLGEYENEKPNGKGIMFFSGYCYFGEFKEGKYNGRGYECLSR
jgi:hypothetical protein